MVIEKDRFAFRVTGRKSNTIYNKISDPETGSSVYPDILFPHSFEETALCDSEAYDEARSLFAKYGSAHCIFLSYINDDDLQSVIDAAVATDIPVHAAYDESDVGMFCEELSLSVTMQGYMRRLLTYYSYNGDVPALMDSVRKKFPLPVSKTEGKKIYEYIRKIILQ